MFKLGLHVSVCFTAFLNIDEISAVIAEINEVIKYLNDCKTCYYCSHVIENYGIVDLLNGTLPQIEN